MRTEASGNGHDPMLAPTAGNAGNEDDDLDLLTAEDVAELFKVKVSWVYGATRDRAKHKMPYVLVGRYKRFQETAVRVWIEKQKRFYPKARKDA